MKLLLDENISYRVLKSISTVFPGSMHIVQQSNSVKEDLGIFDYAKVNEFTIVTFDEDFYDIQLLKGYPPKIIWLRFGNSSNLKVVDKLMKNLEGIKSFLNIPLTRSQRPVSSNQYPATSYDHRKRPTPSRPMDQHRWCSLL